MMKQIPLLVAALAVSSAVAAGISPSEFAAPPPKHAPHVWWHWMNGNVTKEGITADFEAMKAAGIAGAQSFDCDCGAGVKKGPVAFRSDAWYEMAAFAHREAKRLGLELCFANCSGYSSSGGPWVTPEDSMKLVRVTETEAKPGDTVRLAEPPDTHGFYRDIAVLAFPTPSGLGLLAEAEPGKAVDLGAPREVRGIRYALRADTIIWDKEGGCVTIAVDGSGNGTDWSTLASFTDHPTPNAQILRLPRYRDFGQPVTSRYLRARFTFASRSVRAQTKIGDVAFGSFGRAADYPTRTLAIGSNSFAFAADGAVAGPVPDAATVVKRDSIVDLTEKLAKDGTLDWAVPAGRWTVLRIGYGSTGAICAPATAPGRGLEVDKLDAKAVGRFFDGYLGKLVKACGIDPASDPHGRAGFNATLIDSWEVGSQNWTHGFEKTFAAAKGYDIRPWLPVFAGFVVGSGAETDRFCRDFTELVGEEFGRNYTDELARRCHEAGILLEVEPYSGQPCPSARYARSVDLPMCEFWWRRPGSISLDSCCEFVPRDAHAQGKRIIGAESFTSFPEDDNWKHSPRDYKAIGDYVYCHGVNRIVYHRFAHQPKLDEGPGMTMGAWGTHFERTQTWWPMVGEWLRYQTRCQYLLQGGEFVDGIAEPGGKPSFTSTSSERLAWIHRRYEDGAEAWFIASTNECGGVYEVSLADAGKFPPELWNAETGERTAAEFTRRDGRTVVKLPLGWCGSVFVVFRASESQAPRPAPAVGASTVIPLDTDWVIGFPPNRGAPETYRLRRIADLSTDEYPQVKFFSGICTYRKTVSLGAAGRKDARFELSLGEVGAVARVTANGVPFPVVWHPPYRVDITEAVKAVTSGLVKLEIEVANTWVNRLVGDEIMFPAGDPRRFTRTNYRPWRWRDADRLPPSGILGPVRLEIFDIMSPSLGEK